MDSDLSQMTPEERLAAGFCCECGLELAGHDSTAHAATHWPTVIIPNGFNQEAIRRQKLLLDYKPQPAPARGSKRESQQSTSASSSHPSTTTPAPRSEESSAKK